MISGQLLNRPLAITEHRAEVLLCALQQRLGIVTVETIDGITLEAHEMAIKAEAARKQALARDASFDREGRKPYEMDGNIAVIRVEGTLVHKGGWIDAWSGFIGYNYLLGLLEEAARDSDVLGIWLIIDSPGGAVAGLYAFVEELAKLTAGEGGKPIYAWVDETACSAAYAIACVCDRIYGPRDAVVGSIGVVIMHTAINRALTDDGIDVTIFRSGDRKMRGNRFEALDKATAAKLQFEVDRSMAQFAALVEMARNIPAADIEALNGEWFDGDTAVEIGLIDAVVSEREAWSRLEEECDRIKRERRQAQ